MEFKLNRFLNLIRRDTALYKKPVLLGAALVSLLIIALSIKYVYEDNPHVGSFLFSWFATAIIAGGLLLTSIIFWEFKSAPGRVQYLSLPASNLEKIATKWFYTVVLFPALVVIFMGGLGLALSSFTDVTTGWGFTMVKETFMSYWILHPLVFMFSIWYNRYVAPKAVLTALGVSIVAALLFFIMHRLFFHEIYSGLSINRQEFRVEPHPDFKIFIDGNFVYVAKFFGLFVFPVFFLVISYFKMKEKEA